MKLIPYKAVEWIRRKIRRSRPRRNGCGEIRFERVLDLPKQASEHLGKILRLQRQWGFGTLRLSYLPTYCEKDKYVFSTLIYLTLSG